MAESCTSERGKYSSNTVRQICEPLKMLEKGRAKTVVASRFSVPQNTISTWLKNKDKIMKAYEEGSHQRQLRLNGSTHNNLDKALFKWFVKARDHGIPVGGPLLKEKAKKFTQELRIQYFKVSNDWFDRWKTKHGITFKTVSGEAKSCTADMTASWEETTLLTLLANYELGDRHLRCR